MDSFSLTSLPHQFFTQVLKKMELSAGIALYRTCKDLKEEIDCLQPRWRAEGLKIMYNGKHRSTVWRKADGQGSVVRFMKQSCIFDFVIPQSVFISQKSPVDGSYLNEAIIPELEKMAGISLLIVSKIGEEDLSKVVAAANPQTISFVDLEYHENNPQFKKIKNLEIRVPMMATQNWANPQRILDAGKTRRSVSLSMLKPNRQMLLDLLKKWLLGADVGTLEEFSLWPTEDKTELVEDYQQIVGDATIRAAVVKIEKLSETETIITRRGNRARNTLRLKVEEDVTVFLFQ